jgi:hypothetical protein
MLLLYSQLFYQYHQYESINTQAQANSSCASPAFIFSGTTSGSTTAAEPFGIVSEVEETWETEETVETGTGP